MPLDPGAVVSEIDVLLAEFYAVLKANDLGESQIAEHMAKATSAIERLSPPASTYRAQLQKWLNTGLPPLQVRMIFGLLKGLRDDWANGRTASFVELLHGETFEDFVSQADHLLAEGFKLPAAVVAGVTLEQHLRSLCRKHSVELRFVNRKGESEPKKTSSLNQDLYKASVYNTGELHQVDAWLAIRNAAAHGEFDKFTDGEVKLMIAGIRGFIVRNPA